MAVGMRQEANRCPSVVQGALAEEPPLQAEPLIEVVRELVRCLVIAEKNYLLYPPDGKVVQQSLQALLAAFESYKKSAQEPLSLQVRPQELLYSGEVVYREEAVEKNLADRLHRDFIQKVVFLDGIELDELSGFLDCLRQARKADGGDNDLYSLLWGRDFAHIQVDLIDKFTTQDLLSSVPQIPTRKGRVDPEKLRMEEEEERRRREALRTSQEKHPDGDPTLELTEEDIKRIAQLASEEESRSPLHDFVDILLEVRLRKCDRKLFQLALDQIAAALRALIEKEDFGQAARLLRRIRDETRWRLSEAQRHALEESLKAVCDKTTLQVLHAALDAQLLLPPEHEIFQLMAAFGEGGLPGFCELLRTHKHTSTLVTTLADLGKDCADLFLQYLSDPDPVVAQAAGDIVLAVDPRGAENIAPGLRHPSERVRLYFVRKLIALGNESACAQLVQVLKDPSLELVALALRRFSSAPYPRAYDPLLELANAARFHELDRAAQESCFKALLLADPSRAARFIGDSVLRWGASMSARSAQRKTAAVLALRHGQADPCTLKVLKRLASRKRGPLGKAALEVLQALQSAAEKQSERHQETHASA